ncbi:MAG: substrate-binding domain-containing protein [Pseudomonadota bacterium]
MKSRIAAAVLIGATIAAAGAAQARDQIRIVGSSTVFPFSTAVAETFGKTTDFATPVVESTGSGGGLKLFCAGVGVDHPDMANSSRRIKASEIELCAGNGVDAVEAKVGYDGIVVANARSAPDFALTREQIVIALAEQGPKPALWSDIDPSLPAIKIEVLGPPPSSGTRDAFEELVMEEGCEAAGIECEGISIRADGAFIEAGENDNLIVSKLEANPNALGVFGYSFLDQNGDKLKGATVDGVEPTFENIASGDYPVSRSLYFYIKKAHVDVIPGMMEYVSEFMSDDATGEEGYLVDKGLIPLPQDAHDANVADVTALKVIGASDL